MYKNSQDIKKLIQLQNGKLTQEQYLDIYEHSLILNKVYYDECAEYVFELTFKDDSESILCDVVVE